MKYIFEAIADEIRTIFGRNSKDKIYSSHRTYNSEKEAKEAFERSVQKLMDVEKWSALPQPASTFELYDQNGGRRSAPKPQVGDYLRILLPGPLPENWVEVIDLQEKPDIAEFTVRPSIDPQEDEKDVEHFFAEAATSTFKVEREGNKLKAYEIGKNEGINNKGIKAGARGPLNTIVAEGGWAGFQKIQWEKLTDYLVHKTEAKG